MYHDEKQALSYLVECDNSAGASFSYTELLRRCGARSPAHMRAILASLKASGFLASVQFMNGEIVSYALTIDAYNLRAALWRLRKPDIRYAVTTIIAILALVASFAALSCS